jgi:hypothetical protein
MADLEVDRFAVGEALFQKTDNQFRMLIKYLEIGYAVPGKKRAGYSSVKPVGEVKLTSRALSFVSLNLRHTSTCRHRN